MGKLRRLVRIGVGALGLAAYLWLAGAHFASGVRRRKAARRRAPRGDRPPAG